MQLCFVSKAGWDQYSYKYKYSSCCAPSCFVWELMPVFSCLVYRGCHTTTSSRLYDTVRYFTSPRGIQFKFWIQSYARLLSHMYTHCTTIQYHSSPTVLYRRRHARFSERIKYRNTNGARCASFDALHMLHKRELPSVRIAPFETVEWQTYWWQVLVDVVSRE